jgi:hypothetical protein
VTDVRDQRHSIRVAYRSSPVDGGAGTLYLNTEAIADAPQRDQRHTLRVAGTRHVEITNLFLNAEATAASVQRNQRHSIRVAYMGTAPIPTVWLWTGGAWTSASVRVWDGISWVPVLAVKTWNGSSFV